MIERITATLADKASKLDLSDVPREAVTVAKQCCLDWLGVTLAARAEPLADMLAVTDAAEGGRADCPLIGRGTKERSEERRVWKECVSRVDLGGRRTLKHKQTTYHITITIGSN